MKHIKPLSSQSPARANQFQDVACTIILTLSTLLGFIGGEAPVLSFLDDKCSIPTPNENGE